MKVPPSIVEIIVDDQGFYLATEKQIIYCFKPNDKVKTYHTHVISAVKDEDTILSMSKSNDQIAIGLSSGELYFLIPSETSL